MPTHLYEEKTSILALVNHFRGIVVVFFIIPLQQGTTPGKFLQLFALEESLYILYISEFGHWCRMGSGIDLICHIWCDKG